MHNIGAVQELQCQQQIVNQGFGLIFIDHVICGEQIVHIKFKEFHNEVDIGELRGVVLGSFVDEGVEELHSKLVVWHGRQSVQYLHLPGQKQQLFLKGALSVINLDILECDYLIGWHMDCFIYLSVGSTSDSLDDLVIFLLAGLKFLHYVNLLT
jgi:hypothetical protein